ncbi:EF-hand calcium-binding domain-containing protein 4B-like isoform X2 [Myxocyprinus asiaticus]|uniref:EF-hand calcium-binding domain-containing protein 4B-like isoform X2 n=1 Tax=Myxocyprinus asiaticus TaxID=70543 RepID=UPI00222232E9|nr:EF-hand calcium-binding domain-containing protein 4B-like isoform X2 [Myxocyprinus asiaticus]
MKFQCVPENAEPQDDKDKGSSLQSSKTCIEPNSPRRRRKMGSTRKNPRQQLKIERGDDDKEAEKIAENLETSEQEIIAPKKGLEAAEEPTVHNIKESKGSKENLGVPSALTSSCQLEVSGNPVVQERTSPSAKRKFGSRRINKDNRGFGGLAASERRNELEEEDDKPYSSEVQDSLPRDDLMVCDPSLSLRPDQPVSQSVSEHSNMEARNEEAAKSVPKDKDVSTQEGTGAGLVSLDQIIKAGQHDISPGSRQTAHLKKSIKQETEVVQFNVVMLGNSCVGKTSFIRRFHEGQFSPDYCSTIGVDTCTQTVELHDRIVKLHIWDTAGQERFHSITTQVFHKADGLLLMYEITSSKSFISVRDWITKVQERAPDDAIMMLLGNKNDCEREVQIQEGEDLAREYKIHFMECSASTGVNVSESMRTLAQSLVQRKRDKKEEYTTLKRGQPQKKSGCC